MPPPSLAALFLAFVSAGIAATAALLLLLAAAVAAAEEEEESRSNPPRVAASRGTGRQVCRYLRKERQAGKQVQIP